MEVAIGVDRFDFIALAESEADLRLLAGMQFFALIALLGLERDHNCISDNIHHV